MELEKRLRKLELQVQYLVAIEDVRRTTAGNSSVCLYEALKQAEETAAAEGIEDLLYRPRPMSGS